MNKMIKMTVICWAILIGQLQVQGSDENGVISLRLADSIQMALDHHPSMDEAGFVVKGAESKLAIAKAGRYPRLEVLNISTAVPEARGDATFSPDEDTDIDHLGPFNRIQIQMYQPLFTFGRIKSGMEAAQFNIEVAKAGVAKSEADIIYQVKQVYYGLLLAEKIFGILQDVIKEFEKAIETAQERLDKGEGGVRDIDILKLKIGLTQIQKQQRRVEKELSLAKHALKMLTGLDKDARIELRDKLEPQSVNVSGMQDDLKQIFDLNPDWQKLNFGIQAKRAEVEVIRKGHYPVVFLAGQFKHAIAPNRDDQKNPFVSDEFNYLGGGLFFGLKWDWDFSIKAKTEEAEYELKELLAKKNLAFRGFPLQAQKAYLELLEKKDALVIAKNGKKWARSLMVLTLTNYNFGIGEPKELFESLGMYITSAGDYYMAVHDFNMALAKLSQVVGKEFADLEQMSS
ncbi:MAG: TolC family protein [Chlamydiota bacterium]|nr:TolC family protein [Chlamydiota bacterium]